MFGQKCLQPKIFSRPIFRWAPLLYEPLCVCVPSRHILQQAILCVSLDPETDIFCQFLGPETDVLCQFQGPETDPEYQFLVYTCI